jgi:hypothetical protein
MGYSSQGPIGYQQVAFRGLPDTTARYRTGIMMDVSENYLGGAEVIYVKANGTIRMGGLVVLTPALGSGIYSFLATEVPNTANLGRPLYVAMTSMTTGQFGWCIASGLAYVNSTASVAADVAIGIVAAGQGGAVAAGKQINNARCAAPATTTVAKTGFANAGSLILQIPSDEGWFIGAYLSGTGVASGATVVDIDPSGTQVTMSAVSTAIINGTVTATYNNSTVFYNVVHVNRAMAQGPIT